MAKNTIAKDYVIRERTDGKWCVLTKDESKTLGCHDSKGEAEAQLRAIEANKHGGRIDPKTFACAIEGWPIFRPGTWNGDSYDVVDLQQMAEAFEKVGFAPPFKLGHVDDPGAPAVGWVTALRVEKDVLLADITDLHPDVCAGILNHSYGPPSAEIFWDFERDGASFPRVLGGVALLGGEVPAVAGLPHARDHLVEHATWKTAKQYQLPLDPLTGKVTMTPLKEAPPQMTTTVKTFTIEERDGEYCLIGEDGVKGRCYPTREEAEAAVNGKTAATVHTPKETAIREAPKDPKIDSILIQLQHELGLEAEHFEDFKTRLLGTELVSRKDYDAMAARVSASEKADVARKELERTATVKAFGEGILSPRIRAFLVPIYDTLTGGPKVAKFARQKDVDGKSTSIQEDTDSVQILMEFADLMNRQTKRLFGELAVVEIDRPERPADVNAREELDKRIREYAAANKLDPVKDIAQIRAEVFKADPELKEAYAHS